MMISGEYVIMIGKAGYQLISLRDVTGHNEHDMC
jgi:hypothetical protein